MPFRPLPLTLIHDAPAPAPAPSVPPASAGRLYLHSMPGRLESWGAFLDEARLHQLHLVVCMNPLEEVAQLSPQYHKAIAEGRLPFRWQHLPMRDFGLGADPAAFTRGVEQIAHSLRLGERILLHCAAGIGRTGTVAACVLKSLGQSREQALTAVRAAGSNPQSALQSGWVDRF
ncbi:protein-tyrosine phosphatase family protein [Roseateles koreensis]|uniref:Tyrosine-protein phosphatase n=1 Tax=Roseateles koreensis TaxID=2987526 RepID=A0ABT5KT63_9BURK|nr:tyrosine-protein phosphatase [Roseateles koreensis]MDC8786016.1 tyrosine-protein phosphatase [Roseateles koreensis]